MGALNDTSILDEDYDKTIFDDMENEGKQEEKKEVVQKKEDWLIPGKFKTREEFLQQERKTNQYIKQLEEKNKALTDIAVKRDSSITSKEDKDEIDQAVDRLGITNDDMVLKPLETSKKIIKEVLKGTINRVREEAQMVSGNMKADIVKEKLRNKYPDFVIDEGMEDKLAKMVSEKYSQSYIRQNAESVLSEAIEQLGGKRSEIRSDKGYDPEDRQILEVKRKTIENEIREGIKNADVGKTDIFQT